MVADLTKQRFGRLLVIEHVSDHITARGDRLPMWACICDCGKNHMVKGQSLKNGSTRSCGCLREELRRQRRVDDPRRRHSHNPEDPKTCLSCHVTYDRVDGNFSTRSDRPTYYVANCKKCAAMRARSHRVKNLEEMRRRGRESERRRKERDPEAYKAKAKATMATDQSRVKRNAALKKRRQTNPKLALKHRIGVQLRKALRSAKSNRSVFAILGYTRDDLFQHIERQFSRGMTWAQFLAGRIHIDHIVPLAQFDLANPTDEIVRRAWSLPNLRPCWAEVNIEKGDRRVFLI